MNILMMTNTFTPHVGGVARSVSSFTEAFRRLGHRVVVAAPVFDGMPERERDVVRIPAIRNFNGSDFSVVLPIPHYLAAHLEAFRPDVVHSHHPFLLGDTALRIANQYHVPLIFTHHTMYEQYTHYVPGDSPQLKQFVIELSTGYANLSDRVIAPSRSVADVLEQRGVRTPIEVVPTGVDVEMFAQGDRRGFRARHRIGDDRLVVGHLGRLAPEKNLDFLARTVAAFLSDEPRADFLVIGVGAAKEAMRTVFERQGLGRRLHVIGTLDRKELVDACHAMDIFAFASKSETQGIVLTEAMAAGVPVVALDAPGAGDVVEDGVNGRLLGEEDPRVFADALASVAALSPTHRDRIKQAARRTAGRFSIQRSAERMLEVYDRMRREEALERPIDPAPWRALLEQIKTEWELVANIAGAAAAALHSPQISAQS